MRREITRERDGEYVTLSIDTESGRPPHLSITGESGDVATEAQARRMALANWEQYFEDGPDELRELQERVGHRWGPKRMAQHVLDTDGEYHGIGVTGDGLRRGTVHVAHSFGQIRTELAEWFPEATFLFPYHLTSTADLPPEILRAAECILLCDEHDDCRLYPEMAADCVAASRARPPGKHR